MLLKFLQEYSPMKRAGQPKELAKAILFLATNVLGEEIVVDGGQSTIGSV